MRFDELNGVEIDQQNRNKNEGITSTLKNYITVSSDRNIVAQGGF